MAKKRKAGLYPAERKFLDLLLDNSGKIVTYEQMKEFDPGFSKNAVYLYVNHVRLCIQQGAVIAVRGIGYVYQKHGKEV